MFKFLKISFSILVFVFVFNCLVVNQGYASNDIKVSIDGKDISFDVPPTQINGRTLVPLRAIFEALGVSVQWDENTKTITGTKGQKTIILIVDSTDALVDGEHKMLDSAATTINSRVLVPARFISESLGMHVAWNGDIQTVNISENPIIEWKYEGYEGVEPYKEYEVKYIDGIKTNETRYTGKNHEFKKVNLYSPKGEIVQNVFENRIALYGDGWSFQSPYINKTYWVKTSEFGENAIINPDTGKEYPNTIVGDNCYLKIKIIDHQIMEDDAKQQVWSMYQDPIPVKNIIIDGNIIWAANTKLTCLMNDSIKIQINAIRITSLNYKDYEIFDSDPYQYFGWSKSIWDRISNRELWIGMKPDMLIVSLGRPSRVNSSVGSWGRHEQWVYDYKYTSNDYYYFENGILRSWQN